MQANTVHEYRIIQDAAMTRQKFHNLIQSTDENVDIRKIKKKIYTETPREKALFLLMKWKKI